MQSTRFRLPLAALLLAVLALSAACGSGSGVAEPSPLVILTESDLLYADRSGADAALTSLDVTYAEGGTNRPVLLYVHGGGWAIGDKTNVYLKADFFVRAGYVFVSVNYRLYPEATFPAYPVDVAAAIAWTRDHIAAYGGDGSRLTLMGHSAGAHLVALVATDPAYLAVHGIPLPALDAVVALDTQAYDLAYLAAINGGALPTLYATIFGTDPAGWAIASPSTGVLPGVGIPPMVVAYSGGSSAGQALTRRLASERFETALQGAGVRSLLVPAPEKTHAEINREFGAPGDEVTEAVMGFLAGL